MLPTTNLNIVARFRESPTGNAKHLLAFAVRVFPGGNGLPAETKRNLSIALHHWYTSDSFDQYFGGVKEVLGMLGVFTQPARYLSGLVK